MAQKLSFKLSCVLLIASLSLLPISTNHIVPEAAAASKVKEVKPPKKAKNRPDLSYRPTVSRTNFKYAGTVGVLPFTDKRLTSFHGGKDHYFSGTIPEELSDILYLEVKAGRTFEHIKKLNITLGPSPTRQEIEAFAIEHDVDYILQTDLTHFNMLREKVQKRKRGLDFEVSVRFGFVGQIIDAKTGAILWAEPILREDAILNTDKRVSSQDYGPIAQMVLQSGFDDMKQSIRLLGLEIKR